MKTKKEEKDIKRLGLNAYKAIASQMCMPNPVLFFYSFIYFENKV
jgi:hypothetical protein